MHRAPASRTRRGRSVAPVAGRVTAIDAVDPMDGEIAPVAEFCGRGVLYGALSYVDEVHPVGLCGPGGAGIAAREGVMERVTVIEGTLAKAYGCLGGYIAGPAAL